MKRDRDDVSEAESSIDEMADTLMLLSKVGSKDGRRVFTCKTCNREFSSFQALGGHRASHKKPRLDLMGKIDVFGLHGSDLDAAAKKPKAHECSICGQEFPIGQALGGHMRRHRGEIGVGAGAGTGTGTLHVPAAMPVLKKSLSSKRVCLDLNLSPLENDLRLMFGKGAKPVDFVI